jgi:hypothetical protein
LLEIQAAVVGSGFAHEPLPSLCQRLLNGPIQPGTSDLAEAWLAREFHALEGGPDAALPSLGEPWHGPLLTTAAGNALTAAGRLHDLAPLYLLEGAWLAWTPNPPTGMNRLRPRCYASIWKRCAWTTRTQSPRCGSGPG